MNQIWWSLPCATRFLEQVCDAVLDGRNILLLFPEHGLEGLSDRLYDHLRDMRTWKVLPVRPEVAPVEQIYQRLLPASSAIKRTTRTLVEESDLARHVIWVDGLTETCWSAWQSFLTLYEQACRAASTARYPCFVVPLAGSMAEGELPGPENALAHLRWKGRVRTVDMQLLVAQAMPGETESSLRSRLRINLIVNLARWDGQLAMRLLETDIDTLHAPFEFLTAYAERRGWTGQSAPSWAYGSEEIWDGEACTHTALSALQRDDRTVKQCIWIAQVGVLLPYVETQRGAIIDEYGHLFKVPYHVTMGEHSYCIQEVEELEIGHLYYQLRGRNSQAYRRLYQHVKSLRYIRNELAHRRIVKPALLP